MAWEAIRVLLADDHPLVRTGLRAALASEHDIVLIGEAVDGNEVQQLARALQPGVLLLDMAMPGPPAVETVAAIREHCSKTKILVLTAYHNPVLIRGMMTAGVDGYLLKDEPNEIVVKAIRVVAQGGTWVSRTVMDALLQTKVDRADGVEVPLLTDQEMAVLRLMVEGNGDIDIGQALHISERTVRRYLRSIYDKLQVNTRVEAAVRAIRMGLAEV